MNIDPQLKIKLKKDYVDYSENLTELTETKLVNCHWGQMKLFYSELEFLLLVSKYININECLIVYIGAANGLRFKNFFMKYFFPDISVLLYDPNNFKIQETDKIKIKTNAEGMFTDNTVNEVLKIANKRKIIYITDIRYHAEDETKTEKQESIYGDMVKQQKWGIMMDAEFMLIKFRNFYFYENSDEINFINNNFVFDDEIKNKIVYSNNKIKQNDKKEWILYLKGSIYTQLYAPIKSTETRLFVKKIKYYKNKEKYDSIDQEKYKLKYYNNVTYDNVLNYFNTHTRNEEIKYKKSDIILALFPGKSAYSAASEYYLVRKFCIYNNKKPTLKNIIKLIADIHIFLGTYFKNNLVTCIPKNFSGASQIIRQNLAIIYLNKNKEKLQKQFDNIKTTNLLSKTKKLELIKSYETNKNDTFGVFTIIDGDIKQYITKNITVTEIVKLAIDLYNEKLAIK